MARLAARLRLLPLALAAAFEREMEAGRGFLWMPVCFGAGILVYFILPAEPPAFGVAAPAVALAVLAWLCRRRVAAFRVAFVLAAVAAGAATIKLRTDAVAAPVLAHATTATVTGWVEAREGTPTDGARLMVRVASLSGVAAAAMPFRVRVTVYTEAAAIAVGDAVTLRARLWPPSGPVVPGGTDFAFVPFYERIGAVGFAFGAARPAELGPAPPWIRLVAPLAALREAIRARIVAALPGDDGRIAASLIMGDRGPISEGTQNDMRASGLGHVLAIAGLHMALVAGSVFWLVRALLALSPALALGFPIKKWAAAAALATGLAYVAIAGAGVATDRSFIMLAIMLIAVMLDRAALTLRNVAIAAMIILLIWPESLLSVSFQMSFAATVSLIAGYEALRGIASRRQGLAPERARTGPLAWLRHEGGRLLMTAMLGGLATTPFAAYHFQRVAPLTILANLIAMPAVSFIVMPMALATVLLMPLGLEAVPLAVMGAGLDWMTFVAAKASQWSEGLGGIAMVPAFALMLAVAGFLWLALWRERWRLAGLMPLAAAVPIALLAPRPDILADAGGTAAAVRGADGRYQIVAGGDAKFAAENWLRADGDPRAARALDLAEIGKGVACDTLGCTARLADGAVVAVARKPDALDEDCRLAAVVITRFPAPAGCASVATVIDRDVLARGGAEALYRVPSGPFPAAAGPGKPRFRIVSAYPANRRPFMAPTEPAGTAAGDEPGPAHAQ
jgi:competence protein ComEC